MARLATEDLLNIAAWPTGTIHLTPGGKLVGILMPRVTGRREIHQLYSPAQRKSFFPRADWSFLVHVAMNCAAAFETVHLHGQVIGDVNQSGVLVSDRATACLIDCDSFQIRGNGRIFHCEVGVPQFTPPELQGVSFKDVERQVNHDLFGLALLLFHLLFMGRHPFAGRFGGSSEMPIERAISEGRFAFSSSAATYGMMPPPYSLPMMALPQETANLFERAFMRPAPGVTRPTAREWREAMSALERNLKSCHADRGHRFYCHLARCPWCQLVNEGGPNFFISVELVLDHVQVNLPHVDFKRLWTAIDSIPPPNLERPDFPNRPSNLRADPLPESIRDQGLLLRLVIVTEVASAAGTIVGWYFALVAFWACVGLLAVFGIWWIILANLSGLKKELAGRRAIAERKREELKDLQDLWDSRGDTAVRRFDSLKAELVKTWERAEHLSAEFQREKDRSEVARRETQLDEYLNQQFIRNEKIARIGPGRLSILLSYGIETAADIETRRLLQIPGMGAAVVGELVSWREEKARGFVFDPKRAAPVSELRALVIKYRQFQQTFEAKLTSGARDLDQIASSAHRESSVLTEQIRRLVLEIWQADANAAVR